ncbi:hypothetical protein TEA_019527 [Camellia sinensis var. sinensis]|uniref:Terpene synthase metal-binding domain-containing protein n=1 Tax=Camellia sinensis var. sinensis TaxID=542762 RepID=A0A4S4F2L2_CAMSN|nr:hypothetical protein TEA_019527 [Camellia sinensis var. sinensis]
MELSVHALSIPDSTKSMVPGESDSLTSIIDDICDVYGTLEELVLFTDAVERWETSALDQLPEYVKPCYQALLDFYNMMNDEMAKQGRLYCVDYAKSMASLMHGYQKPWVRALCKKFVNHPSTKHQIRDYKSTNNERMGTLGGCSEVERAKADSSKEKLRAKKTKEVDQAKCAGSRIPNSYLMLSTTSYVGMGEVVSKEAFDWVPNDPLIAQALSVICRIMDDMAGHKFEQKRGHVDSVVECYMKQYGASEEEVLVELRKGVTNAWKDINQECLHLTTVPMPLFYTRTKMDTHILEPSLKVL